MPSTNYSAKYDISNFLSVVNIDGSFYLDALDQRLVELIQQVRPIDVFTYTANVQITTLAYNYYNSTTPWWIILLYNGISHPLDLEPGDVLLIPDIRQIDQFIGRSQFQLGERVIL